MQKKVQNTYGGQKQDWWIHFVEDQHVKYCGWS